MIKVLMCVMSIINAGKFIIESKTVIQDTEYLFHNSVDNIISIINAENATSLKSLPIEYYSSDENLTIGESSEKLFTSPVYYWGLDSMDGLIDGFYNYTYTGYNIPIYVVDTGVASSQEFYNLKTGKPRLSGVSFVTNSTDYGDCNGHGTHVASIAGGNLYGVAKDSEIVSVRIFDCNGNAMTSTLLKALNWIRTQKSGVINLSVSTRSNIILNNMITQLSKKFMVISAAGNNDDNACYYSPSSAKGSITVGCLNKDNTLSVVTNYGTCVSLFAPGVDIIGQNYLGGWTVKSGTSISTPFVSGVSAQILEKYKKIKKFNMNKARKILLNTATSGIITGSLESSPNLIVKELI